MQLSLVWIALVITVIGTIPQLQQVYRTNEARDFNQTSIVLSLIANVFIGLEAVRQGNTATIVLAVWFFMYWSILMSYKLNETSEE